MTRRHAGAAAALACASSLLLAACGGERQDANEPSGNFKVEVTKASFPTAQKLAKTSELVITVRNAGNETIPNIAVTVDGFDYKKDDPDLADPNRPQFVIDGRAKNIGGFPESKDAAPAGCETAYVSTWACGKLKAGATRSFRWRVTAVEAGDFKLSYTVAAGLNGKAKAIDSVGGGRPTGVINGKVSEKPPATRVAEDGSTVISGTR